MNLRPAFLVIAATASLLLGATAVQADEATPPKPGQEYCKENPQKCEEARANRKEFCTANPEKCKEQREQMKAKCKADPAKCDQMKQEMREKYKGMHGSGQGKSGQGTSGQGQPDKTN